MPITGSHIQIQSKRATIINIINPKHQHPFVCAEGWVRKGKKRAVLVFPTLGVTHLQRATLVFGSRTYRIEHIFSSLTLDDTPYHTYHLQVTHIPKG